MSDFKKLPCTTRCDEPTTGGVTLVDCDGVALVDGDAVARCSDIPEAGSLVVVTPIVEAGHAIATITVGGVDYSIEETVTLITDTVTGHMIAHYVDENGIPNPINETVTQVTELDFTAATSTLSLTYRNETGIEVTKDVNIPVKVAVEHISPVIINPANTYLNYSNQIVVDANGNFYGFNAAGVPTKLNITETVTTLTGVQATGKTIGTYTNEQLVTVAIKETITTMTGVLTTGTKIGTYTNEAGNPVDLYVPTAAAQVITTLAASFNEATSVLTLTYVNENGTQLPIPVTIASVSVDTSITKRGLVNLTSLQHLGAGDKVINGVRIGKGGTEASVTNTVVTNGGTAAMTTATNTTAVGQNALQSLTTGSANTALGNGALSKLTTGVQNVAVGNGALGNTSATINRLTAVGTNALNNVTTGALCTALGWQACFANTTGSNNIGIGDQALRNNTAGNFNIALGASALTNNQGNGNLAFGQAAMFNTSTGGNNTAIGSFPMFFNTTGSFNLAFGNNAMRLNTTGSSNTVVGTSALSKSAAASFNTAMGDNALLENTTGTNNSAFGRNALSLAVTFSNSSALGSGAQVTGSNQVQLGDAATTTYVYGTVQNRSDARDKADIVDTALGLDFINALRPVDFKWDLREDYRPAPLPEDATEAEIAEWLEASRLANIVRDGSKKRPRVHHGVIAQEVRALGLATGQEFGGFQDHSLSGGEDVLSIGYDEFNGPLIKAVQQLSARVVALEQQLQEK